MNISRGETNPALVALGEVEAIRRIESQSGRAFSGHSISIQRPIISGCRAPGFQSALFVMSR